MAKERKSTISVQGTAITILPYKAEDHISLTDMAKKFGGDALIYSWMRNRNTVEFLGIWEQIHNPDFKVGEFETFRTQAGLVNIEGMNAEFIHMGLAQDERLTRLNEIAIRQLQSLTAQSAIKALGSDAGEDN